MILIVIQDEVKSQVLFPVYLFFFLMVSADAVFLDVDVLHR